jgi:hypothetical protein
MSVNVSERLSELDEQDDLDREAIMDIVLDAWNEAVESAESNLGTHENHLLRTTGTKQTLDAALAEQNDLHDDAVRLMRDLSVSGELNADPVTYCFTCNEWVGVEFRGHLRSTKDAYYYRGPPPEVQELKRRAVGEWKRQIIDVKHKHPNIDTVDEASEFIKQQVDEASDRLQEQDARGGEDE